MVGKNEIGFDKLDKAKKKCFCYKKNALVFMEDEYYFTRASEDMSLSRFLNSKLMRLRWKLRFQEKWKGVTKDGKYGEIFHCDNSIKT